MLYYAHYEAPALQFTDEFYMELRVGTLFTAIILGLILALAHTQSRDGANACLLQRPKNTRIIAC